MTVREVFPDDVDLVVELLERRRAGLRPFAPVFWRPAPQAAATHAGYLRGLLQEGRAEGWRTDDSVLVAARGREGWLVDDAAVAGEDWPGQGAELWGALAAAHPGDRVRFVCPAYEPERDAFARARGLDVASTWWLVEREDAEPGRGRDVEIPGAEGGLVDAPPVYAPGGPLLYLHRVEDAVVALPAATRLAAELRCAGVVVDQRPDQESLAGPLEDAGLRRQCTYYEGTL